jgi:DNA-binding Lrp family transcriptional regulator
MSVQALTWVLDCSEAEDTERLVLISLANHAHKDGSHAFPTVDLIAREARKSPRAVKYALKALREGGAIERTGIGPNRATMYRLCMDEQGLAYRTSTHAATRQRQSNEGATVAPPVRVQPEAPSLHPEGATSPRVLTNPSENRPSTPPQPPRGSARPLAPIGRRQRDKDAYHQALAQWAPCPGADAVLADPGSVQLRELVRQSVTTDAWYLWLCDVHPHAFDPEQDLVVVAVPLDRLGWINDRYRSLIAAAAASVYPDLRDVDLIPCAATLPQYRPHQQGAHQSPA